MHLGRITLGTRKGWVLTGLKQLCRECLETLVNTKLNRSQQCAHRTKKTKGILCFIRWNIARRSNEQGQKDLQSCLPAQSLSDSAVFPIYKVKLTFSMVKFTWKCFFHYLNFYQKLAFLFFKSNNYLSRFPEWKLLPPMNKHTRKGTAKTGSSLLFVCVWVNSYPLLKVHSLTHTNYFPGYPPIGINTIFFLICQPINSWPQQGFLGVRSPWKCVTLIPNIFPKKNPSQGVMDCAKICLDFSNKKKKLTQGLVMGESCNWSSMVTWPLTEEWDPGRMTATAFHSSIAVVLVLFKLERQEGLGSCQC